MAQTFCATGETGCKFWSHDMDMDPFCVRPEALSQSQGFGLSINAMRRLDLCSEDNDFLLHQPDPR